MLTYESSCVLPYFYHLDQLFTLSEHNQLVKK